MVSILHVTAARLVYTSLVHISILQDIMKPKQPWWLVRLCDIKSSFVISPKVLPQPAQYRRYTRTVSVDTENQLNFSQEMWCSFTINWHLCNESCWNTDKTGKKFGICTGWGKPVCSNQNLGPDVEYLAIGRDMHPVRFLIVIDD